jgi:hypothetical protein
MHLLVTLCPAQKWSKSRPSLPGRPAALHLQVNTPPGSARAMRSAPGGSETYLSIGTRINRLLAYHYADSILRVVR